MSTQTIGYQCVGEESNHESQAYQTLTLLDLARAIALHADVLALNELLARTPFTLGKSLPVGLVDLLDWLRRNALYQSNPHADRAYDLTLDKFTRLEQHLGSEVSPSLPVTDTGGTDCRHYFRAFVEHVTRKDLLGRMTGLEQEMSQAKALQRLVQFHFDLALRECQRTSFMTRFVWRLPTGNLLLQMPRSISGRERRRWLEDNVTDVDPARPNERLRVQAIVDARIGQPGLLRFETDSIVETRCPWLPQAPIPGLDTVSISAEGLAESVAREKVANISAQRPAIRALGPARLQELIRRIFEDLSDDNYCLTTVAQEYGLSKATLSRFAGIRWDPQQRRMMTLVPDLWRNTAQVIGSDPDFIEAAKRAGVWQRLEASFERFIRFTI